MEREIIHVDITSFAVTVERLFRPELRERPVVVAPSGFSRSVVMALSPEAWQAGIRKGMVLAKAVRYCREVVVLPPNERLYGRASRAIFKVLRGFSPLVEPSGHGHAYVDITGTGRLFGPPRDTAWCMQREIRRQLRLPAAVGLASNKMVSRIASEVTRPAGLQDVRSGDEASFLSPLPVRVLPGVGPQVEKEFAELNIRVVQDLTAMTAADITLALGRLGFLLHQRARGIDHTPVYPSLALPAVEEEETLAEDSNDYIILKRCLFTLCSRAAERLRSDRQRAGHLELGIRYADYRVESVQEKLRPPLQATAAIYARAEYLLERALKRRIRLRSLYVRLTDLIQGASQLELFADPETRRHAALDSALDQLHRRFGPAAVVRLNQGSIEPGKAQCAFPGT